ncbi:MAG: hypothetical protein HYY44_03365, partial [Deltaproteobacteria bacterium]|nr:hypothetical protein [Deltaproteobacteria bacterium]
MGETIVAPNGRHNKQKQQKRRLIMSGPRTCGNEVVQISVIGPRGVFEAVMPTTGVSTAALDKGLNDALSNATARRQRGFILFTESIFFGQPTAPRGVNAVEGWIRANAGARFKLQETKLIKVGPGGSVIPYIAAGLAIFLGASLWQLGQDR